MTTRKTQKKAAPQLVMCPRCDGLGEEPGAPEDLELGAPYCILCKGAREVTKKVAAEWEADL